MYLLFFLFFFSSRRRHTRSLCDWSSDVCSSDLNSIGLDGMNQLILFRAMQGICGGMMMGLTFAIIGDIFSPAERGRYQRSEERRVGKECRSRGSADHEKKKRHE